MTSPWAEIAGWLVLPAVLFVLASGLGLLVERATRARVPDALLAPLGACAAIVLVMPGYRAGIGGWAAATLVVVGAVAGWVAARPAPARVLGGWAGLAGLG